MPATLGLRAMKGKTVSRNMIALFLLLGAASGAGAPLRADVPADIQTLLQATLDRGDRASFEIILDSALATWPDERVALLAFVEGLNAQWLDADEIQEIRVAERQAEEALAAEKARGLWYYLDPKYWNPQVEAGAGNSTGDTQEVSVSLGASINRSFENWDHSLEFFADFARRQGLTTRQRFTLEENTVYSGWDNWLFVNFGLVEFDRFSGFDFRITETLGIGYQLIDTDTQSLRLEVGPGIRYSVLDDTLSDDGLLIEGGTRTEILGRLAATYSRQITENLTLNEQAGFVLGSTSSRFDNELSLSATLMDNLKARLRFQAIYESDVPDGTSAWDTVSRLTLVYDF